MISIREDFLTFIPVCELFGCGLANIIKKTFTKIYFDLSKMRRQSNRCKYRVAAMRCCVRVVQAVIKEMYPKAL